MVQISLASTFGVSLIGGAVLSFIAVYGLTRILVWQGIINCGARCVWWLGVVIGMFERAIITWLVIWASALAPAFIGGWVLLKFAGGWSRTTEANLENRSVYQVALLGNIVSIGWAVLVGLNYAPEA